ncbi:putative NAD dependent epimerase/dehydratase family protein [Magnetospirillum sp. UT-4]|nr:putative NAD dependent epimerase/dehydratase family protein [Magnetospirillum sp. UT-4]
MNILLIGGTGFVSGAVLREAAARGHAVTVVTRGVTPLPPGLAAGHVRCDRDTQDPAALIDAAPFDAVIDCICMNAHDAAQAVALAEGGKRLIMISTEYAYDPAHRKLFLKESEAVFSDRDDIGGHKARAEAVIRAAHGEGRVKATILRPPHIYGPGSNPGTIPKHGRSPTLLADMRAGRTLHLLQGGLGLIQPIHVADFARIVVAMLDQPGSVGEDYNCSGPQLMTQLDYYKTIAACLGVELSVTAYWPEGGTAPDVNHYVGGHRCYDMGKLNALLPDMRYVPFADGIADWVRHLG